MAASTAPPPLARALYDVYRALPAKERAAFDRLMQGTQNPVAPAAVRSPKEKTGAALTEEAFAEVRSGGGTRHASFTDL